MDKYVGKIGYCTVLPNATHDTTYEENFIEEPCTGEIHRIKSNFNNGSSVNSDVKITMEISFLADGFARLHFDDIRYITYMGKRWRVESVDPSWPRMTLSIGGLFE